MDEWMNDGNQWLVSAYLLGLLDRDLLRPVDPRLESLPPFLMSLLSLPNLPGGEGPLRSTSDPFLPLLLDRLLGRLGDLLFLGTLGDLLFLGRLGDFLLGDLEDLFLGILGDLFLETVGDFCLDMLGDLLLGTLGDFSIGVSVLISPLDRDLDLAITDAIKSSTWIFLLVFCL